MIYLNDACSHQASRNTNWAEDELIVDNFPEKLKITLSENIHNVKVALANEMVLKTRLINFFSLAGGRW